MDEMNIHQPPQPQILPPPPAKPLPPAHETGKRELLLALFVLTTSVALCNFIFYGGGFQLGFALASMTLTACSAAYLLLSGHRPDWYSGALLLMALVIAAGFVRADDGFVKFVMLQFLMFSVNLGLCLQAGQNRRRPGGAGSVLDAPRAFFMLGFGGTEKSGRGLSRFIKEGGAAGKTVSSVALGLLISVPILLILVPLLMNADAAFEGLLDQLPDLDLAEGIYSAFFGLLLGWILYSRAVTAHRAPRPEAPKANRGRGLNALTVGTVLAAVCLLYCVYLFSQLAYFSGGFAGILPETFTMAEYARRGFFEMAWLCAINLSIICGSVGIVKKERVTPLFLRICCLFLGLITIFLVSTASAKMFMYIGSYGLTRLRVLTEVIMLWLGITTLLVCVWLFVPRLPYMKAVVLTALVMGAAVLWSDVDTQVAKYNVRSYQSGQLEAVDVDYLSTLSSGAIPYLYALTEDPDPEIAEKAEECLLRSARWSYTIEDWRGWNAAQAAADEILEPYREKVAEEREQ